MSRKKFRVNNCLIEAAGEDEIERARSYIDYRRNSKETFINTRKPLHLAAKGGFFHICKFLVEKRRVDVNELNSLGETPLYVACESIAEEHKEKSAMIVKFLLDNGANVSISEPSGLTPFHHASYEGRKDLVSIFLDAGVSVDVRCRNGCTPLHFASGYGNSKDIVETMCQNNASVNACDAKGWSPLHMAAFWGLGVETIETLLEFGADIDAQGAGMETALHCAHPLGDYPVAITLLDNGADINIETSCGFTALEVVIARAQLTGHDCEVETMHEILQGIHKGQNANIIDDFDEVDEYGTVEIFIQHLIKLRTAKLFVSQKNLSLLDKFDLPDFGKQCQEEISATKNEELHPGITLFNILSSGVNPTFAKNKPLIEALKYFNWDSFPLYKNIILNNVKKSKLRHDLLESAEKWLRSLLRTSNILSEFAVPAKIMSSEILSVIVSFLRNEELKTLVTCGEELHHKVVHSLSAVELSTS